MCNCLTNKGSAPISTTAICSASTSVLTSSFSYPVLIRLVYALILIQVISVLCIAYLDHWDSAWFAILLAPYLKSIFLFTPNFESIAAMPLSIKIHVVGAFIFIAMVPFTRLMHFLVFPFVYFTRAYQYVIWNWDRKTRRGSTKFNEGVKAKNN